MGYPKVTLASANEIFNEIGIKITQHELGYYEAVGKNMNLQDPKLIKLTHKVLNHLVSKSKTIA
ncbi:hypothetical protein NIES2101_23235 [Calothrix sp. HK-06]|nr:hypothetical protein NIES2101_23235 [Calothrix sp. HK-06]